VAQHDGELGHWGAVAKLLHWAMAVCIMLMIVMGVTMRWFLAGDQALQFTAYQLHKSFGFLLLLFALARLVWRLSAKAVPAASLAVKAHERWLANGVHAALYIAMFGMPISGLLAVSASPVNGGAKPGHWGGVKVGQWRRGDVRAAMRGALA